MERINWKEIMERQKDIVKPNERMFLCQLSRLEEVLLETDVLVEVFLFVVVVSGQAQATMDETSFTFTKGDIFFCRPQNILNNIRKTDDFEAWILFSTFEYAEEIAQLMHLNWSLGVMMRTHEVIHANEEELSRLSAAFRLVQAHQASPARPDKQNSIKLLLCSMLYELNDIQNRQKEPLPMRTYTSAEHLFQRFAKLVNDAQPPFASLTDYAQKLCVTPKYLSAICKQLSGRTASELINEEIIRQAQILLLDSQLSIKEIAERLGFLNQSHFGTFFRRHTGISPLAFRKKK